MKYRLLVGDARHHLAKMPAGIVHTCITSPPYWGLRDYDDPNQIGLEPTPEEYVANLVEVLMGVHRVLRADGTLWLNLGDSYAGYWGQKYAHRPYGADRTADASTPPNKRSLDLHKQGGLKEKDLVGVPWMVAFALRAAGWYLRQDIIWYKPNPMTESVEDRCTKAHEYIFLLSKNKRYYYDQEAIKEPAAYAGQMRGGSTNRYSQNAAGMDNRVYDTRNRRSVWPVLVKRPPKVMSGIHFAMYPRELIHPCVLAGAPPGGIVLDPFSGGATTICTALENKRRAIGIELNPKYAQHSLKRIKATLRKSGFGL